MKTRRVYDTIVLGGGSLGLWTALLLRLSGQSVLVLERAERLGSQSTAKNARLGSRMFVCNPQVWALTHLGMQSWESPPPGIFSEPLCSSISVIYTAGEQSHKERMRELIRLARQSRASWEVLTRTQLESMLPFVRRDLREGGVLERGLRLNVDGMVRGIAAALNGSEDGGAITDVFIFDAKRTADGSFILATSRGSFESAAVVDATGSQGDITGAIFGAAPVNLQASKRHRIIGEVNEPERLTDPELFVFTDHVYWAAEKRGRVLFSPADETLCGPHDVNPDPEIVRDMIKRLQECAGLTLRSLETITAGHRPFVADRVPIISRDPDVSGLFRLLGPSGYGMQGGPAMARVMAALVLDEALPDEFVEIGLAFDQFSVERLRSAVAVA